MDSNISDLLGGVLANPEMMNKVKTLLPLVSQMIKSDDAPPAIPPPVQLNQPDAPVINQAPAQTDNIMANANVAAAIQNLIAALNSTNQAQTNQSSQPVQEAVPAFAQQQPEAPVPQSPPVQPAISDAINIEKTLNTLKNVTAIASPENDHRAKLLLSLKPFLGESRRTKIDTAIKYINAAKIFSSFGKNGFV